MKTIFKELFKFKAMLLLLIITVVASVTANLALPLYLSQVINTAIPNKDMGEVVAIGGTMLLFVLLGLIASVLTGFFASLCSMGLGKNIRSMVFKKIQYFSQTEFDLFSTSSLINRTNSDVIQVQTFINMLLRVCLMAPIMCIGGIVMALAKSATMSLILLVAMPIMIIFVLAIAKVATPISTKMQQKLDNINLVTREKLTGIRVARAFGTESFEEERFSTVNNEFTQNAIKMNTILGILMPGLSLILYGTMVALIAFAGYQIINFTASVPIGDVIAVIQYVMQIMMSVMMLSMVFVMYPRAAVSAKRINEVLFTTPVITNKENAIFTTEKSGYLTFNNVSFTFPNGEQPALKNISFSAAPGEVTAIIGSTGCGKSTLINLIPRFYDVTEGEILINNVNVKDMDITALRNKIGLVPQKAFLFKGSIAENVGYSQEEMNPQQIEDAIKIAQSYDFVMAKEGDFDAPVAQGGSNFSGGQKQRLAIARAIAKKPEIYIFDDSFSALDFKTDAALRKALLAEAENSTVILVAQRISTIKNAHRILVLEKGNCVGIGKHHELLESCKVYREIVYSQLSKEEV